MASHLLFLFLFAASAYGCHSPQRRVQECILDHCPMVQVGSFPRFQDNPNAHSCYYGCKVGVDYTQSECKKACAPRFKLSAEAYIPHQSLSTLTSAKIYKTTGRYAKYVTTCDGGFWGGTESYVYAIYSYIHQIQRDVTSLPLSSFFLTWTRDVQLAPYHEAYCLMGCYGGQLPAGKKNCHDYYDASDVHISAESDWSADSLSSATVNSAKLSSRAPFMSARQQAVQHCPNDYAKVRVVQPDGSSQTTFTCQHFSGSHASGNKPKISHEASDANDAFLSGMAALAGVLLVGGGIHAFRRRKAARLPHLAAAPAAAGYGTSGGSTFLF